MTMKIFVSLLLFIILSYSYEFTCKKDIEALGDNDLSIVEITTVNSCITQHGKIVVRNLRGAVTEIQVGNVYYPVSSTSNYHEIGVLDGFYSVRVIKRTSDNTCYFRPFNVTIYSKDECDPYYVYVVKTKEMVFEVDNSTSS